MKDSGARPLRLWIFNQYASTPDQPATSAFFVAKELQALGWEVTFFASAFNYYFQKDVKSSASGLTTEEVYDGVKFVWLRGPKVSGTLGRILNILSFTFLSMIVGLVRRNGPDVIIGVCPHPGSAFSAWFVSVFRRATFVYEIRDIWPESLQSYVTTPVRKVAYKTLYAVQSFLYQRARIIISVLPEISRYVTDRGLAGKRTAHAPNATYIGTNLAEPAGYLTTSEARFDFVYCGGFSRYQGINIIIDAFKNCSEEIGPDKVALHLVGEGSEKAALAQIAAEHKSGNIYIYPSVSRTSVQGVLRDGDCNVFHLSDIGYALEYGISPNKLIEYLASGKPLVYAMPRNWPLLADEKVGLYASPDDAEELGAAMCKMALSNTAERMAYGDAVRTVANNFDVSQVARVLDAELRDVSRHSRPKTT